MINCREESDIMLVNIKALCNHILENNGIAQTSQDPALTVH